jgi:hypothetical protein
LTTSNITSTGATLNWSAVTGATGYTVQYKTAAGSTWITANATSTSFNVSGLTVGTNYVWQVKASCSTGYSTQGTFTTTGGTGCAAPVQSECYEYYIRRGYAKLVGSNRCNRLYRSI